MPIEGFDYKEFAKTLSDQVAPALPPEISDQDKQYIVNIVFNFCYMAGEALSNDTTVELTADQASIITQFIGEWAFHKSIDVIKSGIAPQFRDGILQKIAFTVFEIAKTATVKGLSQADMIAVVEHHVKKAYGEALEELRKNKVLTDEQFNDALNHSNIDDMAHAQAQEEFEQNNPQPQAQQQMQPANNAAPVSNDNKLIKLATFAIVLKHLPQEKRQNLLNKFSPEDANILKDYASMGDLENKLDQGLVVKCLKEIKRTLPEPKKMNSGKIYEKLYKIVKNSDISKISNMIGRERQLIKDYINSATGQSQAVKIPPRIADIICNHIEEKLTHQ